MNARNKVRYTFLLFSITRQPFPSSLFSFTSILPLGESCSFSISTCFRPSSLLVHFHLLYLSAVRVLIGFFVFLESALGEGGSMNHGDDESDARKETMVGTNRGG